MLDKVKLALRLTTAAFDGELNMLITACKADLGLAGIIDDETKELIQTAVIIYCKANFGFNDKSEKWQTAYDNLKCCLMTSSEYKVVPVV